MATTTNYGWTTPDDTALVKDGAAAIRTLGSSVDSTLKTHIDNTVAAAVPKTIVDAKGDLIAATAADTVSRLAVGTNGQLLSADSTAATGLAWIAAPSSGGMTSLASGSFGSNTTNAITLSSIPQTYNSLVLRIFNVEMFSGTASALIVRANNDASTGQQSSYLITNGGAQSSATTTGYRSHDYNVPQTSNSTVIEYCFPMYSTSNASKSASVLVAKESSNAQFGYAFNPSLTAAITELVITTINGNNFDGGTYILYGVK